MKLPIEVSLVPQQDIIKAPKEHIQDILKKIEVTRTIARENMQDRSWHHKSSEYFIV
jgi:hypothetical protein